jgi:1-acyl-sn-glycerol-3-phosphate acyltransferase
MTLGPHLWQFSRLGKITVVVEFHPPVNLLTIGDRKNLARHCSAAVASGVEKALTGRALSPETPDSGGH